MGNVRPGTFFWVLAPALLLLTIPLLADSHVRIVRLSDVEGDVQVDRNIGHGFENALLNLPITEGVMLRTESDGRAEVEFENGSTLRLAPFTEIRFDQLSLRDSGARDSSVTLVVGILYVNSSAAKGDDFTLNF
ncbi:MAG: FecR domain-containing protein, partial [Candidatus Angelobacter sp.]